jgi:hypothetical protein
MGMVEALKQLMPEEGPEESSHTSGPQRIGGFSARDKEGLGVLKDKLTQDEHEVAEFLSEVDPNELLGKIDELLASGGSVYRSFFKERLLGKDAKRLLPRELLYLHEKGLRGLQNLLASVEQSGPVTTEGGRTITAGDVERAIAQSESVIAKLRAETEGQ